MKQAIKIQGLGVERFFWRRFCIWLRHELRIGHISLEFSHLGYKWSNFQERFLESMLEVKPDIVFTTTALFKHLDEFEQFLQSYQPEELIEYPNIFLFEKKPEKVISEYLLIHLKLIVWR